MVDVKLAIFFILKFYYKKGFNKIALIKEINNEKNSSTNEHSTQNGFNIFIKGYNSLEDKSSITIMKFCSQTPALIAT